MGGAVWPRSRPRCAVSGAEHALSAGERSGLSGGSPGSCAPAVSSIVTPLPSIIIITGLLLLGGPPPQPSTTARIQAPLPSLPFAQQQRSGSHATSQQPAAREGTAGAPERVKAKERETKGGEKDTQERPSVSAPTGRGGRRPQRDKRAGVHTRGRTHTLAEVRAAAAGMETRGHPPIPVVREQGEAPRPRVGHLSAWAPLCTPDTPGHRSRPWVRPPTLGYARDVTVGESGERKTRGKGRGDGVCVGEAGTLPDRCGEHRSAGCPAPQRPGWGEEPPAHPRDKGASCSALAKSLQRCKGLRPGLGARWGQGAQPFGAGVQRYRPPALTSG